MEGSFEPVQKSPQVELIGDHMCAWLLEKEGSVQAHSVDSSTRVSRWSFPSHIKHLVFESLA